MREIESHIQLLFSEFPALALIGPRQVGKTTLAYKLAKAQPDSVYLDLELPSAQRQLDDAEGFLMAHTRRLVVLDEVQRVPQLFAVLRGVIDQRRRLGEDSGQFLLLGSASGVLLAQASESLAGRMAQIELSPFQVRELAFLANTKEVGKEVGNLDDAANTAQTQLWLRGGFPLSYLANSGKASLRWREAFITSYLERDIPALGLKIPATTLRRLWTMLSHHQGGMLNVSQLAASLAITGQATNRYIDVLADLMLIRRLPPWQGNVGKRLVKSPKVYVRDSGVLHALLGLGDLAAVLAHPVAGASWEGFCIEQIIANLTARPEVQKSFYRTSHGAEADLVLEFASGEVWVIEIKRSSAPSVSRGFHEAAKDLNAKRKILIAPVERSYGGNAGVEIKPILQFCDELVK